MNYSEILNNVVHNLSVEPEVKGVVNEKMLKILEYKIQVFCAEIDDKEGLLENEFKEVLRDLVECLSYGTKTLNMKNYTIVKKRSV